MELQTNSVSTVRGGTKRFASSHETRSPATSDVSLMLSHSFYSYFSFRTLSLFWILFSPVNACLCCLRCDRTRTFSICMTLVTFIYNLNTNLVGNRRYSSKERNSIVRSNQQSNNFKNNISILFFFFFLLLDNIRNVWQPIVKLRNFYFSNLWYLFIIFSFLK